MGATYNISNSLHSVAAIPWDGFQALCGGEIPMRTILALAALSSCFAVWDRIANDGAYSAALQRNIFGVARVGSR